MVVLLMFDRMIIKSRFKDYAVNFVDDFSIPLNDELNNGSFFITDANVYRLYFENNDIDVSPDNCLIVEANEQNKSLDKCKVIIKTLIDKKVRRDQRLVAVGGGVIQDITAFSASIYLRGIEWSFFPTTLLAQADSCIGSKTSINFDSIKNIVGNFYPPSEIYIDYSFLETLSENDIKSGIGEILHFFLYSNSSFIEELINNYDDLIDNQKLSGRFIKESLMIKKSVIEMDEFDKGERNKFNYGHTFGHAIETVTDFHINHGQAVCVGMDIANYLSIHYDLLTHEMFGQMHEIISNNIPLNFNWSSFDIKKYFLALSKDKKNVGNKLVCILSRGPGNLVTEHLILDKRFRKLISNYFSEYIFN